MKSMILLAGLLSACSTPPVVLEQGQHGAVLVEEFRSQLAAMHNANAAIESTRRLMVLDDIRLLDKGAEERLLSDQAKTIGRADAQSQLAKRLLDAADARGAARARNTAENQRLEQALKFSEATYAPLDRQLKATSAAFDALGTELTREERLAIARHFARDIAREAGQAKEAAMKAQAEAAIAKQNQ